MCVGLCNLLNEAIRGFGAVCTSGRRRADFMSRKGAMDFVPHLLSHVIRNDVGRRASIRQDFHYTDLKH